MNRLRWGIAALIVALSPIAWGQTTSIFPTGGIAVSCSSVTAATSNNPGTAGGCTSFNILTSGGQLPSAFTWQVLLTGSPTSVTVNIVGSLDGTNWFQLATTSSTTSGANGTVSIPIRFIGCVPATLSGGSSPTVTCQLTAAGSSVTSSALNGATGAFVYVKGNFTQTFNPKGVADNCSGVLAATTTYNNSTIMVDYAGDLACGTHLIQTTLMGDVNTFSGDVLFSGSQVFHQYNNPTNAYDAGILVVPGAVNVTGYNSAGSSTASAAAGGNAFQPCVNDAHSYCNGSSGSHATLAGIVNAPVTSITAGSPGAGQATVVIAGVGASNNLTAISVSGSIATITSSTTFVAGQNVNISGTSTCDNSAAGQPSTYFMLTATTFQIPTGQACANFSGTATIQATIPFAPKWSVVVSGSGTCDGTWQVSSLTATGFIFQIGTGSCTTSAAGTILGPPQLMAFCTPAMNVDIQGFVSLITNIQWDANLLPNVIVVTNAYSQELTGLKTVQLTRYGIGASSAGASFPGGGIGIYWTNAPGAQPSAVGSGGYNSTLQGINMGNIGGSNLSCSIGSVAMVFYNSIPRITSDVTIGNTSCLLADYPQFNIVMALSAGGAYLPKIFGLHQEDVAVADILIGALGTETNMQTGGVGGVDIDDVDACCDGAGNSSYVIQFATGVTNKNVSLRMIKRGAPSQPAGGIINDLGNGVVIGAVGSATATTTVVDYYALGTAGTVVQDWSGQTVNNFPGLIQMNTQASKAQASVTAPGNATTSAFTITIPGGPAANIYQGFCWIDWTQAATLGGVQFGVINSAAPTSFRGGISFNNNGAAAIDQSFGNFSDTSQHQFNAVAYTPTGTGINRNMVAFTVVMPAQTADTLTFNITVANTDGTVTTTPGAYYCWVH